MSNPFERLRKKMKDSPVLMGILNVTPDSFSDGGRYTNQHSAVQQALRMAEEGADIIDIGGESTRPGAKTVSPQEETERVLPVIQALKGKVPLISIDTRNAAVMKAALESGAGMINDVTALTHDPQSLSIAASFDVPVCLMHMRGNPQDMQNAPKYESVVDEVLEYLLERTTACLTAGIKRENIIIDPGIGFGKTPAHNLALLKNLDRFVATGFPILLGTSRKSFIEKISADQSTPDERLGGSLASVLWGWNKGVSFFRVHDVRETAQALKIYQAIEQA
jgi:dihydropteroate synthase